MKLVFLLNHQIAAEYLAKNIFRQQLVVHRGRGSTISQISKISENKTEFRKFEFAALLITWLRFDFHQKKLKFCITKFVIISTSQL